MHQRDFRRDVAQVQRFFDRRIAATDNGDGLAAIEEPVAGRAGRNAAALVRLLGGQAEVHGCCAGGDNQRITGVAAVVAVQAKRSLRQVGGVNMVVDDFGVEALRVTQHAIHQFRALQALDVARPVVDVGRGHQLAALLDAGNDHRVEIGPGSIDGGRVAGRSGPQDQNPAMFQVTHV